MTREVSGSYDTRAEAEAVRARLEAIGIDARAIQLQERTGGADSGGKGLFDHLADYLLSDSARRPGAFLVSATVSPDQLDAAAIIVRAGDSAPAGAEANPFAPRTFVFPEHAERLEISKEVVVREELILKKLIDEHVAEIRDTVRRTEVEVERFSAPGSDDGPGAP